MGADDRLVVGNCSRVRFRPTSEELFAELKGRQLSQRAEVGKPSVELETTKGNTLSIAFASRIQQIVFLNRNAGIQELLLFPVEVARLYMLQRMSRYANCAMFTLKTSTICSRSESSNSAIPTSIGLWTGWPVLCAKVIDAWLDFIFIVTRAQRIFVTGYRER